MSKNHPHDNMYSILGKLSALQPTPAETIKEKAQMIRESVEAQGSILEGVSSIEQKLSAKYAEVNEDDVSSFLARGGKIQQIAPQKGPKHPGLSLASKHIGGGGDKMRASRTGRGSKPQGKPVVGIGEEEVNEKAAPGQEGWIKKNKARFIDQYGKEKGLEVLYATAWKRSKQDESAQSDMDAEQERERNRLDRQDAAKDKETNRQNKLGRDALERQERNVKEGETTKTATGRRHTKTDYPGYPDPDPEDNVELIKKTGRPRKTQTKKPRVDPNAPKKGRGRPKADKPAFSGKNGGSALQAALGMGSVPKKHPKGRVHRMDESYMLDEGGESLNHILNRFKAEVKAFEKGADLDEDLYDALYDYYVDMAEMPYGVQKARTGDPYDWVTQR
ncbi:hypothetical protein, partial [Flavobacterium sp.]|uniref:hypothetical protein n=1 Tax=Flavobacterium sp. TaxID=239 RepID=UPI0037C08BC5